MFSARGLAGHACRELDPRSRPSCDSRRRASPPRRVGWPASRRGPRARPLATPERWSGRPSKPKGRPYGPSAAWRPCGGRSRPWSSGAPHCGPPPTWRGGLTRSAVISPEDKGGARVKSFQGRVAVVTGAASGIGLALAERFAAEGMKVVMADIEAAALATASDGLRRKGAEVHAARVDVSRPEDVERLAVETYRTFEAAHVVCNNAGVAVIGAVHEHTLAD